MTDTQTPQAPSRSLAPRLIGAAALLCVTLGGAFLTAPWWMSDGRAWTNNAKLDADYTVISPRVAGDIVAVHVEDHETVSRGDALIDIDPRDYRAAVDAAEARVASAQARLAEIEAELARQPSRIRHAQAVVDEDIANVDYARLDAERYRRLRHDGNASQQNAQQAAANASALDARRQADQASLDDVRHQTQVLEARRASAQATLAQARAEREQARLSLSHTRVAAPRDGIVAEQAGRVGAWTEAGGALMAIVPTDAIYVTANYREVEITEVRVGQPVTISLDAYPGMTLEGHVDSLAPATGTTFSPISHDDASGNFTKIVQRLPVRIAIEPDQPGLDRLKVGLSVETTIHTDADG
ncbi:HlyD family secretion protein [Halomonas sp. HG01]|uniref:HlyD family secretion protein n=1 Tax=Halomonas sp. HG01 TaxID=1609967 RepID=UPI000697BEE7|nr:HlyD family secretion protein [Halomonas sp. HG01]